MLRNFKIVSRSDCIRIAMRSNSFKTAAPAHGKVFWHRKDFKVRIAEISKSRFGSLLFAFTLFALVAVANGGNPAASPATIEGLVRDVSCPVQNPVATATAFNLKCALECARLGSPLIILDTDGYIYVPISASMPDTDQRSRLLPFVGKYVKVSGTVYERKGTRAIAIAGIVEMKGMHLVTDAQ
jgi:hypothetical protein